MITINSISGGRTSSYMAANYNADYNIFALVCINDKKCSPKDKGLVKLVNEKLSKRGYIKKYGEFIATAGDDALCMVRMPIGYAIYTLLPAVRI